MFSPKQRSSEQQSSEQRSSEQRQPVGAACWSAAVALALACTLVVAGCGRYPQVSPAAFELAKAISNVCNAREPQQLEEARAAIAEHVAAGEITSAEERLLTGVIEMAASGQWERAEREANRLLQDQTDW